MAEKYLVEFETPIDEDEGGYGAPQLSIRVCGITPEERDEVLKQIYDIADIKDVDDLVIERMTGSEIEARIFNAHFSLIAAFRSVGYQWE